MTALRKIKYTSTEKEEKCLSDVGVSFDGKKLFFVFENGEGYTIPRAILPEDDGSPIIRMEIFDHRCAVAVSQASGRFYDFPWDSIKHYAGGGTRERPKKLGGRLKQHRRRCNLSQEKLANKAGISRVHLSRLESNQSEPSLDTLIRIAAAFELPVSELLT